MARKPTMDRLTSQLNFLPGIIGQMGTSIANSQKLLNADFMDNVVKLMGLIERAVGPAAKASQEASASNPAADPSAAAGAETATTETDQRLAAIFDIVKALAPSRYQFTETTLDFSADLAETKDVAASAGLGVGLAAVTVNAGLTLGFGYDYRSAARITTVLHAREIGATLSDKLLERAKEIQKDKLNLPELSKVEKELWDQTANVVNALFQFKDADAVKAVDAKNPAK
jgi:hypothetical protein